MISEKAKIRAKILGTILGGIALGTAAAFYQTRSEAQVPLGPYVNAEPAPKSAVVLAQCGRVVGLIVIDAQGGLHPVPPDAMSDALLSQTLAAVGDNYVTAVTPCPQSQATVL